MKVQLPGDAPVGLDSRLAVLGGLDAAQRRRWADALGGRLPALVWPEGATDPITTGGSAAVVIRGADLTMPEDHSGADPAARDRVEAALSGLRSAEATFEARTELVNGLSAEWDAIAARLAEQPPLGAPEEALLEATREGLE
ncbi:MAG TPA: hypothetical protein VI854_09980, partial [Acidimicrobiia bacterium]|nr:hypothetical protein [Acidimicrobiia bacterium]